MNRGSGKEIEWYIPLQLNPFPSYPDKHLHVYEPFVLMQIEDASFVQSFAPISHSLTSININDEGR